MRFDYLPSLLTGVRFIAGPLLVLAYILKLSPHILLFVFLLAATTDFFDGWIARKWTLCSEKGAWFDHLADKILVTSALSILCMHWPHRILWLLSWAIMQRELLALAARSFPKNQPIVGEAFAVSFLGKLKTTLQFVSISLLFLAWGKENIWIFSAATFFLFFAVICAWISLLDYYRRLLFV